MKTIGILGVAAMLHTASGMADLSAGLVAYYPFVGQWYHLAATRTNNVFSMYIDGVCVRVETNNYVLPNPNAPLSLGAGEGFYTRIMMDDVRIYQRALEAQEVLQLFDGTSGAVDITTTPTTVSYYTASFAVSGTNSLDIVGEMWVSNANVGGPSVSFPAAPSWSAPSLALAEGPNVIRVYGSNGRFLLKDVRIDKDSKSVVLGGDVAKVSLDGRRVEWLKFTGTDAVVSNVTLGSAKTISMTKQTLVGTVAVSNGFETLTVMTVDKGRILAGMAADADLSGTPARAAFKAVKAKLMIRASVAGADKASQGNVIVPKVQAKAAESSWFYHTKIDDTIAVEAIEGN